ncbi:MAG: YdeI/OmpD-associated family protein [Phaeodactylibacter sp.]|nr:YdeI/OmpD-associated family protein [Phaeodactylibacter sp.]
MEPKFFPSPSDFRAWLEEHHDKQEELWVGYYKKATKKPSITWPESVDEALCFGWIDGLRKSVDEESYKIRFTPRRPTSTWSAVNIRRFKELKKEGRIQPQGQAAYERRAEKRSERYSYEQGTLELPEHYAEKIRANRKAWDFFQALPPSVKKPSVWYVMSARREETRLRRLETLIQCSEEGERIPPLRRGK